MSGNTVYAIASGKGGVGKTTTVANLGTALVGAGQTVALVDADLGMANLAGFVSLSPDGPTLHDVLSGEATIADATYEVADGIAAVPSGTELEGFAATDVTGLGEVVETLRGEFDYVLVDAGAGVSHESVLPLGIADRVVLVSTPEPASVQDVRKTIELTEQIDGEIAGLVVNCTRPGSNVSSEEIANRLGVDLLGTVPEDETMRDSVYAGTPLVAYDPDAPAARAYRALAAGLANGASDVATAAEETDASASGGSDPSSTDVKDTPAEENSTSPERRTDGANDSTSSETGGQDVAVDTETSSRGSNTAGDDESVTIPDAERDGENATANSDELGDDAIPFHGAETETNGNRETTGGENRDRSENRDDGDDGVFSQLL